MSQTMSITLLLCGANGGPAYCLKVYAPQMGTSLRCYWTQAGLDEIHLLSSLSSTKQAQMEFCFYSSPFAGGVWQCQTNMGVRLHCLDKPYIHFPVSLGSWSTSTLNLGYRESMSTCRNQRPHQRKQR